MGEGLQRRTTKCDRHAVAWSSCSKWCRYAECEHISACGLEHHNPWSGQKCRVGSFDCAAHSEKGTANAENHHQMVPHDFDWTAKMAVKWGNLCTLGAVWTQRWGILTMDNHYWWTWAKAYESQLKCQSNELCHTG